MKWLMLVMLNLFFKKLKFLRKRRLSRYSANEKGSTAVEFALVGPIFLALLYAIFETSMVFWSNQILQTAVTDASRLVFTGNFTASASTPAQRSQDFVQQVCNRLSSMADCTNRIKVDIRQVASFSGTTFTYPIVGGVFDASGWTVPQNIGGGQIVLVRAAYEYKVFIPALTASKANFLNNGNLALMGIAAFRTEPF